MKKLIIVLIILIPFVNNASDTTYVKNIVDTSAIVNQNIELKEQNKRLKSENIILPIFGGVGFVSLVTTVAVILIRP